jgi:hypothetical protein
MTRFARGVVIVLLAVLLVAAVLLITSSWSATPLPPLPNPNGYNDFVKAGQMVSQDSGNYTDMNVAQLRTLVASNAAALKLAALGLSRECRTPMDLSTNFASLSELPALKRVAQALAAEGKLAELENRPGDAVQSYLTAVRMGYAIRRGGVMITALVGCAIEAIGTAGLERTSRNLDARQSRDLAASLEQADAQDEPPEQMLKNERDWTRRKFGLTGQLQRLIGFRSIKQGEAKAVSRLNSQQARVRLLLIDAAARAYELDKGSRPRTLSDLVPTYLRAVPLDPMTQTNMSYRP